MITADTLERGGSPSELRVAVLSFLIDDVNEVSAGPGGGRGGGGGWGRGGGG